ncbi:amidase [Marinivivus vitaminiproducens]|uniref:amidase n=1 Tax=Marinivivus vitaminiproducens TaxID=3035935 RepID=UPI0027A1C2DB|nr:amidase [Geminicoccaceae bacterium SCSIO 64248]
MISEPTDLADFSAAALVRAYRRGQASPVEAVKAVLARIDAFDPAVNAFCWRDDEASLKAGALSEARWARNEPMGRLDGVPATIKDLLLMQGAPTRRGSRSTDDAAAGEDSPATARLREAGAVLVGKTTTPEFGWKGVTDSPLTGVTRNPWNTGRTPGGSSGGASVAAALGMGALHVGTDGGGSIRIPSAFTGTFGLKPSFGRVPAYPMSPMGTVSHVGPMTRTVTDAAMMLSVMAQPDARDWYGLPDLDGRDYTIGLEDGVRGLRVAYSRTLGYLDVDPAIAALVDDAVDVLGELGAIVEEADPGFEDPWELFTTHWYAGAGKLLAAIPAERLHLIDEGLRRVAAEGADIPLAAYLDVEAGRRALGVRMRAFHERYDLLVLPTLPLVAFEAGIEFPDALLQGRWTNWAGSMYPFNLTQQPAASCPAGLTPEGLPVGLQIVGPQYRDDLVLRAARAYESARPFAMPKAPNVTHQAG